ncbi:hypothetical protein BD408DRAFT_435440 [Parasitella parasitica]|nr:hypothetical protein BD408DRAFT_435440 [Parasitella parasitica]
MAFEFLESGQFKVVLGKSFDVKPKKKAQKFFGVKRRSAEKVYDPAVLTVQGQQTDAGSSDKGIFGKEAKLEKKNERYQVEMKHANKPNVMYDAQVTADEEYNCILIFNDETKTFTLERQSAQINLTNRKLELPNGQLNHSPVPKPFIHTPPIPAANNTAVAQPLHLPPAPAPAPAPAPTPASASAPAPAPALALALAPAPAPAQPPVQSQNKSIDQDDAFNGDDFDFDISKDMDAILDSDVEDDKSESESDSDVFEEIAAPIAPPPQNIASPLNLPKTPSLPASPNIPINLALPATPQQIRHPSPVQNNNNSASTKKRKVKMASAPIRHPGIACPVAAIPPATNPNLNHPAKKLKTTRSDTSSSSGSSDEEDDDSSSGSESGSTESSSGSESDSGSSSSDDMDFESLANDISMSLSKGGPSAPPSPQHPQQSQQPSRVNTPGMPSPSNFKKSPYESNTPTPTNRPPPQNSAAAGPMSLRALFKEDDEEEELSSSDDEDSD